MERTTAGFRVLELQLDCKNPSKQEMVVLFGIVLADKFSWPLTNSPFQEASKIVDSFFSFFCLQESLRYSEGVI